MADITFPKSPSIFINDQANTSLEFVVKKNDNEYSPCVIGITKKGPAFVPYIVSSNEEFENLFGTDDVKYLCSLAVGSWLKNNGSSIYVTRVLGAGDCKERQTSGGNEGRVLNAGFVVGQKLINSSSGLLASNSLAGSTATNSGLLGRTYFLTTLMSESIGSKIFSDAGIQTQGSNTTSPIIRGILFAPSGVLLSLSSSYQTNNSPTTTAARGTFGSLADGGAGVGTVDLTNSKQEFVLLLNGHSTTTQYPNIITASFDTESQQYFVNQFNTDPVKLQLAGHYLYSHYDIGITHAVVTGAGVITPANYENKEPVAFLLTSSLQRNTGSVTTQSAMGIPNYENFEDRFSAAKTPWITSQNISGKTNNLFRFHTVSDGFSSLSELKITINNIVPSSDTRNPFCSFDVDVRDALDTDVDQNVLLSFKSCNLDENSNSFISKKIGDEFEVYDFDTVNKSKKIITIGKYPLTNALVRIELSQDVSSGDFDKRSIPCGFRGIYHLVTSGTTFNGADSALQCFIGSATSAGLSQAIFNKAIQSPVQFRENLFLYNEAGPNKVDSSFTWGVQYENKRNINDKNADTKIDPTLFSLCKYFPSFHTTIQNPLIGDNHGQQDLAGCVRDSDIFNENRFSLERVQVITGSSANGRDPRLPNPDQWSGAVYSRNGILTSSLQNSSGDWTTKIRFINPDFDLKDSNTRLFAKFTVPFMGGFDGLNIFDNEKSIMSNESIRREYSDSQQYSKNDSTSAAFIESIKITSDKSNVDSHMFILPGIRQNQIIDYAIQKIEERSDAVLIFDIEQMNSDNLPISGTNQSNVDSRFSADQFSNRFINNSYAISYFPDVVTFAKSGTVEQELVSIPPSVIALSMIAKNDKLFGPQTAPMGTVRGKLSDIIDTNVKFQQSDIDYLIERHINPIISSKNQEASVFPVSQLTCLGKDSIFDRINMRRLSIFIRRRIKKIASGFLFDQKSFSTLNKLQNKISNEMKKMQTSKLFTSYKLELSFLDETINNQHIISGKIFILPNQSDQMLQIDFTNIE